MTPPSGSAVRPGWKVLATSLAAIIPAIVTLLLAFPVQVERMLESITSRLSRRDVVRGIQKEEVHKAIKEFDLNFSTRTLVAALQPDGGVRVVWVNPAAGLFWERKNLMLGETRYPSDDSVTKIVLEKCIKGRHSTQKSVACTILGNTHTMITFPSEEGDVATIEFELARLSGRIDRHFLGL